jgi:hypothetical protein
MMLRWAMCAIALLSYPVSAQPPSIPGSDAPELAAMGPDGVGFRTVTLAHKGQPDFQGVDPDVADAAHQDTLTLTVDYYWG